MRLPRFIRRWYAKVRLKADLKTIEQLPVHYREAAFSRAERLYAERLAETIT